MPVPDWFPWRSGTEAPVRLELTTMGGPFHQPSTLKPAANARMPYFTQFWVYQCVFQNPGSLNIFLLLVWLCAKLLLSTVLCCVVEEGEGLWNPSLLRLLPDKQGAQLTSRCSSCSP